MRALIDTVLPRKIRPKCDRLHGQPRRQARLLSSRTPKSAWDPATNTRQRLI